MYETFQKFLRGDAGVEMETIDGAPFDKASWTNLTPEGASVIKYHDDITFTGHSFGSATGVSRYFELHESHFNYRAASSLC